MWKGWKKLVITSNVSSSEVEFIVASGTDSIVDGNGIWVPSGTSVSYSVSATDYITATGTNEVTENESINVILNEATPTLTINPIPADATVVLTASGYEQDEKSITVPYGTTVAYSVSATGYVTVTGSIEVASTQTLEIELEVESS